VLRPDGSQQRYTLLSIGPLARVMESDPRSGNRYLTTLTTPAIRIQARASRELTQLRRELVPEPLHWWVSILGPEPAEAADDAQDEDE
jgi:hypothetical protein